MLEEKDPNIIIDSSSIIALYKLNLIDILKDLYNSVNVPEAVLSELGHDLPHWIKILPVNDINKAEDFRKKLGDGESEVITLGIEKEEYVLVLDDWRARQTAKKLEIVTDEKLRRGALGSDFKTDLLVSRKQAVPGKGIRHLILVRDNRVGFQGFDIIFFGVVDRGF